MSRGVKPNQAPSVRSSAGWVYLAAALATVGVLIHLAALVAGPAWFAFFGAPPAVVESARAGTWLAPVGALVIAGLMALCAAYAVSALGLIRRLPLLRHGLAAMGFVCLIRALAWLPLALKQPELFNTFEVVAALVWGLAGVGFMVGVRMCGHPGAAPPA
jgi:hypothetical protein